MKNNIWLGAAVACICLVSWQGEGKAGCDDGVYRRMNAISSDIRKLNVKVAQVLKQGNALPLDRREKFVVQKLCPVVNRGVRMNTQYINFIQSNRTCLGKSLADRTIAKEKAELRAVPREVKKLLFQFCGTRL